MLQYARTRCVGTPSAAKGIYLSSTKKQPRKAGGVDFALNRRISCQPSHPILKFDLEMIIHAVHNKAKIEQSIPCHSCFTRAIRTSMPNYPKSFSLLLLRLTRSRIISGTNLSYTLGHLHWRQKRDSPPTWGNNRIHLRDVVKRGNNHRAQLLKVQLLVSRSP